MLHRRVAALILGLTVGVTVTAASAHVHAGADTNLEIVSISVTGKDRRNVSRSPRTDDYSPSVSPDGRQIAFVRTTDLGDRNDVSEDIWLMNADGSNMRPFAAMPDLAELDPAWSPDGSAIAYTVWDPTGCRPEPRPCGRWSVAVRSVAGGEPVLFEGRRPRWSPSGKRVAFEADIWYGDSGAIAVSAADGAARRAVSRGGLDPSWSPSGKELVFEETARDNLLNRVYIARTDGSGVTRLTTAPAFDPVWNPRLPLVAFWRYTGPRSESVFVVQPGRRSSLRRLSGAREVAGVPSWSRDGRWIAYLRLTGRTRQIHVVRRDGTLRRQVTHEPGTVGVLPDHPRWGAGLEPPVWTRTGRLVYAVEARRARCWCSTVVRRCSASSP